MRVPDKNVALRKEDSCYIRGNDECNITAVIYQKGIIKAALINIVLYYNGSLTMCNVNGASYSDKPTENYQQLSTKLFSLF